MLTLVSMRFVGMLLALLCFVSVAEAAPTVHVNLPSAGMDEAERSHHIEAIRRMMRDAYAEAKTIDVTVAKLSIVIGAQRVDVSTEIKVVICAADDRILTLGSGSAAFSIPRRQFRANRAIVLRHQVLRDALEEISRKLRAARPVA